MYIKYGENTIFKTQIGCNQHQIKSNNIFDLFIDSMCNTTFDSQTLMQNL